MSRTSHCLRNLFLSLLLTTTLLLLLQKYPLLCQKFQGRFLLGLHELAFGLLAAALFALVQDLLSSCALDLLGPSVFFD